MGAIREEMELDPDLLWSVQDFTHGIGGDAWALAMTMLAAPRLKINQPEFTCAAARMRILRALQGYCQGSSAEFYCIEFFHALGWYYEWFNIK
eukprot:gene12630-12759_t